MVFVLFVAILLGSIWLVGRALALPAFPGRTDYLLMIAAADWWTFAHVISAAATDPDVRLFYTQVSWLGIIATPCFWMLFVSAYVHGAAHRHALLRSAAGGAFGLVALAVAVTNGSHGLLYSAVTPAPTAADPNALALTHGPAFKGFVAVMYTLLGIVSARTLVAAVRANPVHRMQLFGMLVVSAVPWTVNAAYVLGGMRVMGFDPTPIAFCIVPFAFDWLITRRGLLSAGPIALQTVFGAHPDGLVVTTPAGSIIEVNAAARALFGMGTEPVGRPFAAFAAGFCIAGSDAATEDRTEHWQRDDHTYEVRIVTVRTAGAVRARVHLLREISDLLRTQRELQEAALVLRQRLEANQRLQEQLRDLVVRDSLTGLHNRRVLDDLGERLVAEATTAHGGPLTALALDLDHFKRINDTHGHKTGDDVLVAFAALVTATLRPGEYAVRMGGEEFLVLMPGTAPEEGAARAEALRLGLADRPVATPAGALVVTFSGCVASLPGDAVTFDGLLQRMDEGVYAAKAAGRNRVMVLKDGATIAA